MTPISGQDRNKAIGLVVAVVVVFGLLIWRTLGAMAPNSEAPHVVQLDAASSTNLDTPTASPSLPATVVDVVLPADSGKVDPFRTVLPTGGTATKAASESSAPKRGANSYLPVPPLDPGFRNLEVGSKLPTESLPTEEPKLVGVMSGNPPLGVFVIGTKEEICRQGEVLSDGFLVVSIRAGDATIVKKSERITLIISPQK